MTRSVMTLQKRPDPAARIVASTGRIVLTSWTDDAWNAAICPAVAPSEQTGSTSMETDSQANKAISSMRWGILWIALGAGVTLVTYLRASAGGRYWFMWGLIALGLFEMIVGYVRGRSATDANERSRL